MAYDEDDIILIGGSGVHRSVIATKLAPLGWNRDQIGVMTDDEIKQVMASKARAPVPSVAATQPQLAPKPVVEQHQPKVINLDALDSAPDTEVMTGVADASSIPEPTSGITPVRPLPPPPPKPGVPGARAAPQNPYLATQPQPAMKPPEDPRRDPEPPVNTRPTNDPKRLMSILEAAATMVSPPRVGPATKEQARRLVTEHHLRAAFMAIYPRQAARLFDQVEQPAGQTQRADQCEGGVILAVEEGASVHIITNRGVLTINGRNLSIHRTENA